MTRHILTVPRHVLFPKEAFQGFLPLHYTDFLSRIKEEYEYRERNDALENDPSHIQIIPYVWLINKETKQAFIYKRAPSNGEYKEKRHLNKISGGIGGHIDKEEHEPSDPIMHAAVREMHEEIQMDSYPEIELIGYINEDSNMFNKVHMGIVGLAQTTNSAQPADGMAEGAFYTKEEVETLFANPENDVEPWTRITWPVIRDKYLS